MASTAGIGRHRRRDRSGRAAGHGAPRPRRAGADERARLGRRDLVRHGHRGHLSQWSEGATQKVAALGMQVHLAGGCS